MLGCIVGELNSGALVGLAAGVAVEEPREGVVPGVDPSTGLAMGAVFGAVAETGEVVNCPATVGILVGLRVGL